MKNLGLKAQSNELKKITNKKAKIFRPPKSGGRGLNFDLKVDVSFLAK